MKYLAHQDGKIIYGNLRFRQDGLLPDIDAPTAKWISFVNREIEPSIWSKSKIQTKAPKTETGVTPVREFSGPTSQNH